MSVRRSRLLLVVALVLTSASLGNLYGQRQMERRISDADQRIEALYREVALNTMARADMTESGTGGHRALVEEIKRQLQTEMGLLPMGQLRKLRESFVELNAYDSSGALNYGTAGYLGSGHFITVKHVVLPLDSGGRGSRASRSITIRYKGDDLPAHVVDSGDAEKEVSPGDWAIIAVNGDIDLPPLRIDTNHAFQFADPIVRMGNDYSKGIILSTGYVGQRMPNGLVTSLTDGHPGVSGGGVVDEAGTLVGIPIGRMEGDYRFSFILPLRDEMFRKVTSIITNPQ